ncbi:MAG: STAS domain-containing protein [Planctomycetota bacterium]
MESHRDQRTAAVYPAAMIVLEDGALTLNGNPARADFAAFEQACHTLCRAPHPSIVVDLTRCTYLNSMFIGVIVDTVIRMKGARKHVRLAVSPEVGRFFNMAHLCYLFSYEIQVPAEGNE